jgi:hypothetical protein
MPTVFSLPLSFHNRIIENNSLQNIYQTTQQLTNALRSMLSSGSVTQSSVGGSIVSSSSSSSPLLTSTPSSLSTLTNQNSSIITQILPNQLLSLHSGLRDILIRFFSLGLPNRILFFFYSLFKRFELWVQRESKGNGMAANTIMMGKIISSATWTVIKFMNW